MIYFDNNSTTPLLPEVKEKMIACFDQFYGNAASKTHAFGWQADELTKKARQQVADAIGAETSEIYFTSGATESISLAFKIIAENYSHSCKHIISCQTEHKAVLDELKGLEKKGFEIDYLPVNNQGEIDLELLEKKIRKDTIAIALMHANNETGVVHPIKEIGNICAAHNIVFFSDCTQSIGKIELKVKDNQLGMACLSAHKFNGPKGIGVLYVSRKSPRIKITNSQTNGAHENGLRAGTLNVPGIVGMGEAIYLATSQLSSRILHLQNLRDHFEDNLKAILKIEVTGSKTERLPNTSNIVFKEFKNSELIKQLPELAFSVGSACMSTIPEPSHVLTAMKVKAENAVRFSFGVQNTKEEINQATMWMERI